MDNKLNKSKVADQKPKTADDIFFESESGKIWNEIKNKEIQMFALPAQKVSDYCKPAVVEPTKLYLITSATSTLPALEFAIGKGFMVENYDKYIVVSRTAEFPLKK
jgi:hypothetical protein